MAARVHPIVTGIITSALTLALYYTVVIFTTPNLPPDRALVISSTFNWPVIVGLSSLIGVQFFLSSYSRTLPCAIPKSMVTKGATSSGSAFSAFLSFFSLVQVGCCGSWLFILSLLPGVIGVGASGFLLNYSTPLMAVGLSFMTIMVILSIRSVLLARRRARVDQQAPNTLG